MQQLVIAFVLLAACDRRPIAENREQREANRAAAADEEAMRTVRTIKAIYPSVCEAADASESTDPCFDEKKGYAQILKCIEDALVRVKNAETSLKNAPPPSGACGTEFARVAAPMVSATQRYLADAASWLRNNRARLESRLVRGSITEICQADGGFLSGGKPKASNCRGRPEMSSYPAMSFGNISDLKCTDSLFRCGLAEDNFCGIQKVADRLELCGNKRRPQTEDDFLYVRATGRRVTE